MKEEEEEMIILLLYKLHVIFIEILYENRSEIYLVLCIIYWYLLWWFKIINMKLNIIKKKILSFSIFNSLLLEWNIDMKILRHINIVYFLE